MIKLHGYEIRVGDEVFDFRYGKGVVISITPDRDFPIHIDFYDIKDCSYKEDGREWPSTYTTLHWPGVQVIHGAPPKRKQKVKVWDWVIYKEDGSYLGPYLGESEDNARNTFHAYTLRKVEGTEREIEIEEKNNDERGQICEIQS